MFHKKFNVLLMMLMLFFSSITPMSDPDAKIVTDAVNKLKDDEITKYSKMQSLAPILKQLGLQPKHAKLFRQLLSQKSSLTTSKGGKLTTQEEKALIEYKIKFEQAKKELEEVLQKKAEDATLVNSEEVIRLKKELEEKTAELNELKQKMGEIEEPKLGHEKESSKDVVKEKIITEKGKNNSDEAILEYLKLIAKNLISGEGFETKKKQDVIKGFVDYIKAKLTQDKNFLKKENLSQFGEEAISKLKQLGISGIKRSNMGKLNISEIKEKFLKIFQDITFNFDNFKDKLTLDKINQNAVDFTIKYFIDAESDSEATLEDQLESDAALLKIFVNNIKSETLSNDDLNKLITDLKNLLINPNFFLSKELIGKTDEKLHAPKLLSLLFNIQQIIEGKISQDDKIIDEIKLIESRGLRFMLEAVLFLKMDGVKALDSSKMVEGAETAVANLSKFILNQVQSLKGIQVESIPESTYIDLNSYFKNIKNASVLKSKLRILKTKLTKIEGENIRDAVSKINIDNITLEDIKALKLKLIVEKNLLKIISQMEQSDAIMKRFNEFMKSEANPNLKMLVKILFIGSSKNQAKTKIEQILSIKKTPKDIISILISFLQIQIKDNDKHGKYIFKLIKPYFIQYLLFDEIINKFNDIDANSEEQKKFIFVFLKYIFDALNSGKIDEKIDTKYPSFFSSSSKILVGDFNKYYSSLYNKKLNELCKDLENQDVSNFILHFNAMVTETFGQDLIDAFIKAASQATTSSETGAPIPPPPPPPKFGTKVTPPPSTEIGPDNPPPIEIYPPRLPPLPGQKKTGTEATQTIGADFDIEISIKNIKPYLQFLKKLEHLMRMHYWASFNKDIENIQTLFKEQFSSFASYLKSRDQTYDELAKDRKQLAKELVEFNSLRSASLQFYSNFISKPLENVIAAGKIEIKSTDWTLNSEAISIETFEKKIKEAIDQIQQQVQVDPLGNSKENIDKYIAIIENILESMKKRLKILKNEESQNKLKMVTITN